MGAGARSVESEDVASNPNHAVYNQEAARGFVSHLLVFLIGEWRVAPTSGNHLTGLLLAKKRETEYFAFNKMWPANEDHQESACLCGCPCLQGVCAL